MRKYRDRGNVGWLIVELVAACLVVAVVGLLLDGLGVSWGGYVVLAAVAVFAIAFYVVPFVPTRWPRRRSGSD